MNWTLRKPFSHTAKAVVIPLLLPVPLAVDSEHHHTHTHTLFLKQHTPTSPGQDSNTRASPPLSHPQAGMGQRGTRMGTSGVLIKLCSGQGQEPSAPCP